MSNIEDNILIFIEEWQQYSKNLHTFCDLFELFQIDNSDNFIDVFEYIEKKSGLTSKQMFSAAYALRKKLFLLGEENLCIGTVYHWNSFKKQFPIVEEIEFLTPFSFTLYWGSIPELMNLYKKKGLREANFVCYDFIENLVFQYPESLEKFALH